MTEGVKYIVRTEVMYHRVDSEMIPDPLRYKRDKNYLRTLAFYQKSWKLEQGEAAREKGGGKREEGRGWREEGGGRRVEGGRWREEGRWRRLGTVHQTNHVAVVTICAGARARTLSIRSILVKITNINVLPTFH